MELQHLKDDFRDLLRNYVLYLKTIETEIIVKHEHIDYSIQIEMNILLYLFSNHIFL